MNLNGHIKNAQIKLALVANYRYGALVAFWCLSIFALSSVPGNRYPQVSWEHADKLVHVHLYLLGGLLAAIWYASRGWSILLAFVFCAFYGLSDEVHQLVVPRRSFSYADLTADCVGSAIGVALYCVIKVYRPPLVHRLLPYKALPDSPERMKTT